MRPAAAWSKANSSGSPKRSWLAIPRFRPLEWAQVVAGEDRVGVERRLAAKYGFDVRFTERDDGKLTVARERSRYIPVTYIAPMRGNQAALGFDLASESTRRAAVEQAERTGQPVATGRILSVQQNNEYSFLLFQADLRRHRATASHDRLCSVYSGSMISPLRRRPRPRAIAATGCCCSTRRPRRPNKCCIHVTLAVVEDDMLAAPGVASDVVVGGRVWRIVILPPEGDGLTRLRLSDPSWPAACC